MIQDVSIAVGLLAILLVAFEVGFRAAQALHDDRDPGAGAQIGAIQGAVLGLLGLLLAFSFAAAGARFLERQDLIVEEANAIGTAHLRADLLDEPHRSELRAALGRYVEHRLEVSAKLRSGIDPAAAAEIVRLHTRIWDAAIAGVREKPAAMIGVLPPVNEIIDLHSTRVAAAHKHLPGLVMGLLIACSVLALGVMGYASGTAHRRRAPLTIPLALLVGTALWITIDLDNPRAGLLQLSDAPLKALQLDPRH
jgi:hypothetical protein